MDIATNLESLAKTEYEKICRWYNVTLAFPVIMIVASGLILEGVPRPFLEQIVSPSLALAIIILGFGFLAECLYYGGMFAGLQDTLKKDMESGKDHLLASVHVERKKAKKQLLIINGLKVITLLPGVVTTLPNLW